MTADEKTKQRRREDSGKADVGSEGSVCGNIPGSREKYMDSRVRGGRDHRVCGSGGAVRNYSVCGRISAVRDHCIFGRVSAGGDYRVCGGNRRGVQPCHRGGEFR